MGRILGKYLGLNMKRRALRTSLIVVALTLASLLAFSSNVATMNLETALLGQGKGYLTPDVVVSTSPTSLLGNASHRALVASWLPEVELASRVQGYGIDLNRSTSFVFQGVGMDDWVFDSLSVIPHNLTGGLEGGMGLGGILIPRGVAEGVMLSLGDQMTVQLEIQGQMGSPPPTLPVVNLTVVGIYDVPSVFTTIADQITTAQVAYLNRSLLQGVLGVQPDQFNYLAVKVPISSTGIQDYLDSVAAASDTLYNRMQGYGWYTSVITASSYSFSSPGIPRSDSRDFYLMTPGIAFFDQLDTKLLAGLHGITQSYPLMILVVALFFVSLMMVATVHERRREFGILRATGASVRQLYLFNAGESLIVTGIAVVLAFLLTPLMTPLLMDVLGGLIPLSGFEGVMHLSSPVLLQLLGWMVLLVGFGLVSALFPTYYTLRGTVADLLQERVRVSPLYRGGRIRKSTAFIVSLIMMAIVPVVIVGILYLPDPMENIDLYWAYTNFLLAMIRAFPLIWIIGIVLFSYAVIPSLMGGLSKMIQSRVPLLTLPARRVAVQPSRQVFLYLSLFLLASLTILPNAMMQNYSLEQQQLYQARQVDSTQVEVYSHFWSSNLNYSHVELAIEQAEFVRQFSHVLGAYLEYDVSFDVYRINGSETVACESPDEHSVSCWSDRSIRLQFIETTEYTATLGQEYLDEQVLFREGLSTWDTVVQSLVAGDVVISQSLADNSSLHAGQVIALECSSYPSDGSLLAFGNLSISTVAEGIPDLWYPDPAFPQYLPLRTILLDIHSDLAISILNQSLDHFNPQIEIKVEPGKEAWVTANLQQIFPDASVQNELDPYEGPIAQADTLAVLIGNLTIPPIFGAVAAFGFMTLIGMHDRRREHQLLFALGGARHQVTLIASLELLSTGTVALGMGGFLGWIGATVYQAAWYYLYAVYPLLYLRPEPLYAIPVFHLLVLGIATLLSVIVSIVIPVQRIRK